MKFTKITDLKYGDHFIWADDYTRDFMCADEETDRLAVLRFEEIDRSENDKLWFLNHNGDTDCLYFDERCRVIVTQNQYGPLSGLMNPQVRCIQCGDGFSDHCDSKGRLVDVGSFSTTCRHFTAYFAPAEVSLRYWHPEAFRHKTMTEDEFFESIGL